MAANQEQIEARLAAYIDGELDAKERAEIEKHLAGNPQHKKLIEELTTQRDWILALPREKAPAEIGESLQSQLERSVLLGSAGDVESEANMQINRWPQRLAIAAVLLLTTGLGVLVYKVLPSNKPPTEFAAVPGHDAAPATAPLTEEARPETSPNTTPNTTVAMADKDATRTDMAKSSPADGSGAPTAAGKGGSFEVAVAPPAAPSLAPAAEPPATPPPTEMAKLNQAALDASAAAPSPVPPASGNLPLSGNVVDEKSKIGPIPDSALALKPGAISNSTAASEQPLANAMTKSSEPLQRKGGDDVATRANGGGFGGGGGGRGAGSSGVFGTANSRDVQIAAQAGSSGSITLLVSTDDVSIAGEQVKTYLTDNGIAWEPTPVPALAPNDSVSLNRLRSQKVEMNRGPASYSKTALEPRREVGAREYAMAKQGQSDRRASDAPTTQVTGQLAITDNSKLYSASTTQPTQQLESVGGADSFSLQKKGTETTESALASQAPASQPTVLAEGDQRPAQQQPFGEAQQPGLQQQRQEASQQPATAVDAEAKQVDQYAFYCRGVTTDQAHELEGVLSSRPGQAAQVLAAPATFDQVAEANGKVDVAAKELQLNAPPVAASTMPAGVQAEPPAPPAVQANQDTNAGFRTMRQQLAVPADKMGQNGANNGGLNNGGNINDFNQQGMQIQQAGPQQMQPNAQGPERVDLLILVCRDNSAATQPANAASEPAAPQQAPSKLPQTHVP